MTLGGAGYVNESDYNDQLLTIVVMSWQETGVGREGVAPSRVLYVVAVRVGQSVFQWTAREHAPFLCWTRLLQERSSRGCRTDVSQSDTKTTLPFYHSRIIASII